MEHTVTASPRVSMVLREPRTSGKESRGYLHDLSKFVGCKSTVETADNEPEHRNSMQNHLERRKLIEVNQETRFNRIMDNFKCLDTFVDVRMLVKEMDRMQEEPEPSANQESQQEFPQESQRVIMENHADSPYLKLIERANKQMASQTSNYARYDHRQLNELVNELSKTSKLSHRQLDESYPLDAYRTALFNRLSDEEEFSRRLPTNPEIFNPPPPVAQPTHQIKRCPSQIDSEYYRKFKQNAEDMQSKLHHILEAMHVAKWKNRTKQPAVPVQHKPPHEKPLLDSKYRAHAPKNFFRFRDTEYSFNRFKLLNRKPLTSPSKQNNHCEIEPRHNHTNNILSLEHSKSRLQLHRLPRNTVPHSGVQQSKLFTDMKQLHQKYSFKRPLIKDNILRKIVDFIDGVEKEQFEFRRHNEQTSDDISRLEASKQADFDRFLEERVDINIEDMRGFCQRDPLRP